jgi:uncharacterized protein
MYLKQKTKGVIVTVLIVLSFGFSLKAKNYHHGSNVDLIYSAIKDSEPVYEIEESILNFQNEGMNLVCTLTVPKTNRTYPIVITLNGFTGNRNDIIVTGTDEYFYARLSRILAEQGIASLRIDFRGSGESDGSFEMTTIESQISDTRAAIDFIKRDLRRRYRISRIGVLGFSQGGLVAAVTAGRDWRVDSVVLWSAPANPVMAYEELFTRQGFKKAMEMGDGSVGDFGVYIGGQYVFDIRLSKEFFTDLITIDPLVEIKSFKGPLMSICGTKDVVVWPQPLQGKQFLKYHKGYEKFIEIDCDHSIDGYSGPEKLDKAIYWSTAWFIKTL